MTTSCKLFLTLLFLVHISTNIFALEKRVYETIKVNSPPKIDGVLDDTQWQEVPIATNFTVFFPDNGQKAYQKTEARIVYNDNALFIGAFMHENSKDSTHVYLTNRDEMGIGDYFGIFLNPYNDDQSFTQIFVTSAGVQWDRNGTINWNIVYKTAVNVTDSGWYAEMEIPYSALRFPKTKDQDWAFDFIRGHSKRSGETSWNYINNENPNIKTQLGLLRGIKNVDPPIRLSLTPYFSTYLNHSGERNIWTTNFKGGLDVKYGINESFTLDMMLIPDFGQVQSDDIIHNLTPFETFYNEKRQFFTEGQELFGRANLFYSRRIGAILRKHDYVEDALNENQEILENSSESKLINATKISGKTSKGLSIGLLNAMTNPMDAIIIDTLRGEKTKYRTQSFTNYNVSVIEQSLKYNSFISLINTNITSPTDHFKENVVGTEFNFYDKNTNYNLSGYASYSSVKESNEIDVETGIKYRVHIGKKNGSFRFGMARNVESENYNQNNLGYSRRNNYITHAISLNHHITKPIGIIKNWRSEIFAIYNTLYKPEAFTSTLGFLYSGGEFKNNFRFGNYFAFSPRGENDYFEARVDGRVYKKPKRFEFGGHFTTDNRKRLVYRPRFEYESFTENGTSHFDFSFDPSIRLNSKFSLHYNFRIELINNNFGYVDDNSDTGEITFGRRDRKIITNHIQINYIFSNKASLSFRLRHYCSTSKYDKFYDLNLNGDLNPIAYFSTEHDMTFNTFNFDLVYKWQFAPGSEFSLVWKNAIAREQEGEYYCNYLKNVSNLFDSYQINSFSLKILYYLDWQYLKKANRK